MLTVIDRIKKVDAFPKTMDGFRVRTSSGAVVSICTMLVLAILFITEFSWYMTTEVVHHMEVDTARNQRLSVHFNVTFPRMACGIVSVDAMDVADSHQLDVSNNVFKKRLDKDGRQFGTSEVIPLRQTVTSEEELLKAKEAAKNSTLGITEAEKKCGSCYGAAPAGHCCNTCDQVRAAYREKAWIFNPVGVWQCANDALAVDVEEMNRNKEGCNVYGYVEVPRAAGNVHFAPGKSYTAAHQHVHDMLEYTTARFNTSHIIHSLSFGETYSGAVNPLDNHVNILPKGSAMFQYFVKVVPTTYTKRSGRTISTNQYSVTSHMRPIKTRAEGGSGGLPGVFFFYEISPVRVQSEERSRSLGHFLTRVCAVIGGVFTVMGLVDKYVHRLVKKYSEKSL